MRLHGPSKLIDAKITNDRSIYEMAELIIEFLVLVESPMDARPTNKEVPDIDEIQIPS
jgi:hypothetical protein